MRILPATFSSNADFLGHYSEQAGGVFVRTDLELRIGEPVMLELDLPVLPSRTLVRGRVAGFDAVGAGAWVRVADEDRSTRDFVVALARGEAAVTGKVARRHVRYPVELPVDWRAQGSSDQYM